MHRSWNYIHDYIGAAVSWDEASPIAPLTKGELRRNSLIRAGKCSASARGRHQWVYATRKSSHAWTRRCKRCGGVQHRDADGVFYFSTYKDDA